MFGQDMGAYFALTYYIKHRFGMSLDEAKSIDFETLFSYIETDLDARPDASIALARSFLLDLIGETLQILQQKSKPGPSDYDSLSERLAEHDSVVSFNWDLLLLRPSNR